jgi:SHS2 domain-containing protein
MRAISIASSTPTTPKRLEAAVAMPTEDADGSSGSGVEHEVLPQRAPKKRKRRSGAREPAADESTDARVDGRDGGGTSRANAADDVECEGFVDARAVVRYAARGASEDEEEERAKQQPLDAAEEDEDEIRARRGVKYAYKDHTADIQIHAWGENLSEAFSWAALGMFDYMTPLEDCVAEPLLRFKEIRVSGHDLDTLLFSFLDELLFVFHTEMLICNAVQICDFDRESWSIRAIVGGTTFVDGRTRQGTEIKAITYSAMQIIERENLDDDAVRNGEHRAELFVIVDI